MKRITYISNFSSDLTPDEIETIAEVSVRNNSRDGLTGSLFCFRGMFYQILEGDEERVDTCYARISKDPRHTNIFVLKLEKDIQERRYPDWSMKTVVLDSQTGELIPPIRNLLDSLSTTHRVLERYAPERILDEIQQGGNPLDLTPRKVERAVMFVDLLRSTTMFEHWSLEESSLVLSEFYERSIAAIELHGGSVSKLTGDGLMAYYPIEHTDRALLSAQDLLNELAESRAAKANRDGPLAYLYAGIGLAAGQVLEGNIGNYSRRDFTLLGDTVNKAARLESVTRKVGQALVFDDTVLERLDDRSQVKKIGLYQAAGKAERLRIYTLPGPQFEFDLGHNDLKQRIVEYGARGRTQAVS